MRPLTKPERAAELAYLRRAELRLINLLDQVRAHPSEYVPTYAESILYSLEHNYAKQDQLKAS